MGTPIRYEYQQNDSTTLIFQYTLPDSVSADDPAIKQFIDASIAANPYIGNTALQVLLNNKLGLPTLSLSNPTPTVQVATSPQIIGDTVILPGTPPFSIRNDLLPGVSTDQVTQACMAITPSPSKPDTVASVNAVLASQLNSVNAQMVGPTFDSNGNSTGQMIGPLPPNANGLQYSKITDPVAPTISYTAQDGNTNSNVETNPAPALKTSATNTPKKQTVGTKSSTIFPMQDTIGGSDLSIFYMAEVIDPTDLANNVPTAIARKNLVMVEFDSVLSLTYSTIRERFPVRSLGSSNAKGITNGIRTISGHIACNVFTEDVLSKLRSGVSAQVEKFQNASQAPNKNQSNLKDADSILGLNQQYSKVNNQNPLTSQCKTMLLDQLPPFNLLIMGVTERGTLSRMMIKNVSIIDESQYQGTQQPNIINKVSWVAEDIVPMTATQYDSTFVSGSLSSIEEGYIGGNWDYNNMADMTASSLLNISADSITRSTIGGI